MYITCLDLEGVLVPEIWIAFSEETKIPELKITTRDEPDYDKLMKYRIGILKEHHLGLKEIQETIRKIDPLPGAKKFLDELRTLTQVIILSDTFTQFASPLIQKLGWPTIFCNTLEVAQNGEITGFKMRIKDSKLSTVKGGMSGPCVKPMALRCVFDAFQKVSIPIIGCGGITNSDDVIEFILAGATCVSIGTQVLVEPKVFEHTYDGLEKYLKDKKIKNIKELQGKVKL